MFLYLLPLKHFNLVITLYIQCTYSGIEILHIILPNQNIIYIKELTAAEFTRSSVLFFFFFERRMMSLTYSKDCFECSIKRNSTLHPRGRTRKTRTKEKETLQFSTWGGPISKVTGGSSCGRGAHLLPRDRRNSVEPATLDVIARSLRGIITYYGGMLD